MISLRKREKVLRFILEKQSQTPNKAVPIAELLPLSRKIPNLMDILKILENLDLISISSDHSGGKIRITRLGFTYFERKSDEWRATLNHSVWLPAAVSVGTTFLTHHVLPFLIAILKELGSLLLQWLQTGFQ